MSNYSKSQSIREGIWSLIVGLKITAKNFLKPTITVHYPRETVPTDKLEGYRGHIELVPKPKDPFTPKCIMCNLCATVCPSGCIKLVTVKEPIEEKSKSGTNTQEDKKTAKKKFKKKLVAFELNYNYCSLCGLCVQNCSVKSLRFSKDIYLAGYSKEEFEYDLLARLRAKAKVKSAKELPQKNSEG
ncbi:MAG: 4Fe-4S double cluster binding domain-containing protein [Desulfonauticus sp.]|nr:4Fe-4S double cluster binding domain-containing protein [Desulfonauticus sp.]